MKPMRKRRLILFLDGTWNDADASEFDTNVTRMRNIFASALGSNFDTPKSILATIQNDSQHSQIGIRTYEDTDYMLYYGRGVGTGPGLDRLKGGIFGNGLDKNVRRAYKFLSRNYIIGSEIFIFGFSRGAYTARTLVGYIGSSGLLKCEHCNAQHEQEAWTYYKTSPSDRLPADREGLEKYVHSFSEVRIACLGVFDTVGALGIPTTLLMRFNRERYEFHDVEVSPIVRLNLHALAIDEQRPQFAASVMRRSKLRWNNSVVEQAWFPGVHADIGGGYIEDNNREDRARGIDEITLDWMLKRIKYHFPDLVSVEDQFAHVDSMINHPIQHTSRSYKYWLSPVAVRSIGNIKADVKGWQRPVSYNRHEEAIHESVHISAIERLGHLVPFNSYDDIRLYAPSNLVAILPNIYNRYCLNANRPSGSNAISVTIWSGEVVDDNPKSDDARQIVADSLKKALVRLKSMGVSVEIY